MADTTNLLIDDAVEKVQSTLSRVIATRLVPFISLALVPAVAWAQAEIGINLDPTALAVFIGSSILGLSGAAIAYIRGRLQGVYGLHAALIDKGIDAIEDSKDKILADLELQKVGNSDD